jgi:hypothetical protein
MSGAALSAVLVRLRSAREMMFVGSVAVLLAALLSPPPATVTEFVTLLAAVCETLTETVMAG